MPTKKILVVEDEPISAQAIRKMLEARGYQVISALEGSVAVSMATAERPDLIILDLGLPSSDPFSGPRWDGFQVMDWLNRLSSDDRIPVIVLTVQDPAVARDRALASGAAAFFQKPADAEELLAAIQRALGEG